MWLIMNHLRTHFFVENVNLNQHFSPEEIHWGRFLLYQPFPMADGWSVGASGGREQRTWDASLLEAQFNISHQPYLKFSLN